MTVQIIEAKLPGESQRGRGTATTVQIIEAKLPGKSDLRTKTLRGYAMERHGRLIAVLEKDAPPKQKNSFQVKFTMPPGTLDTGFTANRECTRLGLGHDDLGRELQTQAVWWW